MNAKLTIPCNHANFGLSPYAWKPMGSGDTARVEAIFPGAYFKTIVKGTTSAGLVIDGTANNGVPPGGTQGSYDTGHPSQLGHAIFGACVAVQVQKVLTTTTGAER